MKLMKMSIKRKLYLTYLTGLVVTILLMMTVGFIAHGNRWLPPIAKETEASPENMMTYAFQFRRLNSVEEASRSINMAVNNLKGMGRNLFWSPSPFGKKQICPFAPMCPWQFLWITPFSSNPKSFQMLLISTLFQSLVNQPVIPMSLCSMNTK